LSSLVISTSIAYWELYLFVWLLDFVFSGCHNSVEFSSGHRLIDIFSSCFSFHHSDWKGKESKKAHLHILDKLILQTLGETNMAVVVSNVSIKNQVATFIAHVYTYNNPIIKTHYHIINVTFTKQNFSSSNIVLIKLLKLQILITLFHYLYWTQKILWKRLPQFYWILKVF